MTAQMMDQCRYAGELWEVCSMPAGARPDSKDLGIQTSMEHTANYSGRVDTYAIVNDRLVLETVRASYLETLAGFSGEVVAVDRANSIVRFDLERPVSGWMVLGKNLDLALFVRLGFQTANRFHQRAHLRLADGVVVEVRHEEGSHPDPPPPPMSRWARAGCALIAMGLVSLVLPISLGWKIGLVLGSVVLALVLPSAPSGGPARF